MTQIRRPILIGFIVALILSALGWIAEDAAKYQDKVNQEWLVHTKH
jgi:hypothetical protein